MAMDTGNVTIIFSNQIGAWGSFYYQEKDDVLRVNVKPVVLDKSVEWLKYEFVDHSEKQTVLAMQWERMSVPFRVEVDVDNICLQKLRQDVTGLNGFNSMSMIHASQFCFNKNINLEEALSWAQKSISGPFGVSSYMTYNNLALGYEKLNRTADGDAAMKEAMITATLPQFSVTVNHC
jgi:hypothetical protein